LKSGHVAAVGLDVYERESGYFFVDSSAKVIADDSFARLLTFYNVFMTLVSISLSPSHFISHSIDRSGHQAFLTREALENIADTTVQNLLDLESTGTSKFIVEAQK